MANQVHILPKVENKPALDISVLKEIVDLVVQYGKHASEQKTRRSEIEVKKNICLKMIESEKDRMQNYLDQRLSQQKNILDGIMTNMYFAVQHNQTENLERLCSTLITVMQTDVFAEVKSVAQTQKNLLDPQYVWDL